MHELGSLLCPDQSQGRLEPGVDEGAKLPNHFVIERIVQDCFLLCPDDNALPGRYLGLGGHLPQANCFTTWVRIPSSLPPLARLSILKSAYNFCYTI